MEKIIIIDNDEGEIEIGDGDVLTASMDAVRYVLKHNQYKYFTWGDSPADLLLVDAVTANLLVQLYNALSLSMQKLMCDRIEASRDWLITIVKFAWSKTGG